jgi:hypothetical protein
VHFPLFLWKFEGGATGQQAHNWSEFVYTCRHTKKGSRIHFGVSHAKAQDQLLSLLSFVSDDSLRRARSGFFAKTRNSHPNERKFSQIHQIPKRASRFRSRSIGSLPPFPYRYRGQPGVCSPSTRGSERHWKVSARPFPPQSDINSIPEMCNRYGGSRQHTGYIEASVLIRCTPEDDLRPETDRDSWPVEQLVKVFVSV